MKPSISEKTSIRQALESAAAIIRSGRESDVNIGWYSWDEADYRETVSTFHRLAWRFGLAVGRLESFGNGHFSMQFTSERDRPPRTCSGSRGRGRKQASAKRRRSRKGMGFWNIFVGKTGELSEQRDDVLLQGRMFRKRRGPKGNRAVFVRTSWTKAKAPCSKCVFRIRKGKVCSACRRVKLEPVEADAHLSSELKTVVSSILRSAGQTPAEFPASSTGKAKFKPIHYGKILRMNGDGVDIRIESTEHCVVVQFGLHGRSIAPIETSPGETSYYQADAVVIRSVFRAFAKRNGRRASKVFARRWDRAVKGGNLVAVNEPDILMLTEDEILAC
ncbi:hypothetical protein EKK58_05350 [Candidatus Dependentiae bacterium]|nr:MAG: hypothetical protein EKK58_05350 [Candidatus Dependentiae bacterium]